MEQVQNRYSLITDKFPREFILLQGKGCFWKKCVFCDYYDDVSNNPFEINSEVIDKITGKFGVIDVINSGSTMELDDMTIEKLINKVEERNINEIWLEVHWAYKNKLQEFAKKFKNSKVKFRTGVETFNPKLRSFWNKGIPENVTPEDLSEYFDSVCLLVGTENQSFEDVVYDIKTAKKYFERFMVNVFVPNTTKLKKNNELINRFINEIYPNIKDDPTIEISLNITDLGVG